MSKHPGRIATKQCEWCGEEFTYLRRQNQKYCSRSCNGYAAQAGRYAKSAPSFNAAAAAR